MIDLMAAGNPKRLCALFDLPDGDARGFDPLNSGRDTVLIVRRGNELFAWHDDCPHQPGTRLPWKKNAYLNGARSHIVCSAHGALFEVDTGLCVTGPCLGQYLKSVPVTATPLGDIEIDPATIE